MLPAPHSDVTKREKNMHVLILIFFLLNFSFCSLVFKNV